MFAFQAGHSFAAVDTPAGIEIHIEHPHTGARAGGDTDHRARVYPPPSADLTFVERGVLQSVRAERMLVGEIHWKHRRVARRITECRVERPRLVFIHQILPPSLT